MTGTAALCHCAPIPAPAFPTAGPPAGPASTCCECRRSPASKL